MARTADDRPVPVGLAGALRRARGSLSQKDAAWQITDDSSRAKPIVSQGTISKLEQGKQCAISAVVLQRIESFIASRGITEVDEADVNRQDQAGEPLHDTAQHLRSTHFHTDRQVRVLDQLHWLLGRPDGVPMNEWEYLAVRDTMHAEGIELAPPMI